MTQNTLLMYGVIRKFFPEHLSNGEAKHYNRRRVFWLPHSVLLTSQRVYLRHNRDVARAKINEKFISFFLWFNFSTKFPQNKAKCMYPLDLNVHCSEICAYLRFCETKEIKGENSSVLHSLSSLPPTTY